MNPFETEEIVCEEEDSEDDLPFAVFLFNLVLAEKADSFEKPKTFVAVSSIMTWAKTKIENEDADSLTEDEFRRRKAHPNFKNHLATNET